MNNEKLEQLIAIDKNSLPADGGTHFNRLIFARSPYLLQHAENPVEWREWGDDAFQEAKERDLPLFISIGYATCHWCHVMADESFSHQEVADILNHSFIPVKVDREERPDIDDFYMTAARVLTGGGGWPLNIFTDTDRRPFFALTYLPRLPANKTPGFVELLKNLTVLWHERKEVVFKNASEICRSLMLMTNMVESSDFQIELLAEQAFKGLKEIYDPNYGGFGLAVKFPMPVYLSYLLQRTGVNKGEARSMACKTLEHMMTGGICDQLAGGFHRYTTDQKWAIPHFEKMLYDQALLTSTYADAYIQTSDSRFLRTALNTARFTVNELMIEGGVFCAGLDADCDGEEGLYYTWEFNDLVNLLTGEMQSVLDYWGVSNSGDLDGRCILKLKGSSDRENKDQTRIIDSARKKLLEIRATRVKPLRDAKVITSWNALMISALVKLYTSTTDVEWLDRAETAARFIFSEMVTPQGRLLRNWLKTPSPVPGFAEDYAYLCMALIDLTSAVKNDLWIEKLKDLIYELDRLFIDKNGSVFYAGNDSEKMPIELPTVQDGVMPATAGICATVMLRSGRILQDEVLTGIGERIVKRYRGLAERHPTACLTLIMAEELAT